MLVKQPKNMPSVASIDTAMKRIQDLNHERSFSQ